jgi:5-methylcytosine-specific restriction endonuclease McrA
MDYPLTHFERKGPPLTQKIPGKYFIPVQFPIDMAFEKLRAYIETIQDPQDRAAWLCTLNKVDGVNLSNEGLVAQIAVAVWTLGIANVISSRNAKKKRHEGMRELELLYQGINPITLQPLNAAKQQSIQPQVTPNKREHISRSLKDQVWRRDNGQCQICGSVEWIEFDHIVPVVKGGPTTYRNLQLLCQTCNRRKGAN